jgi:hypothetical protein
MASGQKQYSPDHRAGPVIRPRPQKAIGLGQDHPRAVVVKPKAALSGDGDLDGKLRIRRGRVRDRQHSHQLPFRLVRSHKDDGARPVFDTLFLSASMLRPPQIAVANDEAWDRIG